MPATAEVGAPATSRSRILVVDDEPALVPHHRARTFVRITT